MKLHQIPVQIFNLDHTLRCGQVFRWQKKGDEWIGVVKNSVILAKQEDEILTVKSDLAAEEIASYFRLDDDMEKVYGQIGKDKLMKEAIARYRGLRLVSQDPWECLISYVCSRNAPIKKIKSVIFNLSKNFGNVIKSDDHIEYTFPEPDVIAGTTLDKLGMCGFRYGKKQAREILEIAKLVSGNNFDLERLKKHSYLDAKEELMNLRGVGHKVADCVLLFSLDKLEAFPIDVHMRRLMRREYFQDKNVSDDKIRELAREYFGKYAGYAQEYLFYHERSYGGGK
ncbi:MAG: DNA glycosylase [Methanocellales archaeon]|nr:DNA glycosylase [Methanocellales archaeon]